MITREQAFKIIGLFQTAYKESYRDSTPEEIEQKAAIYRDILQDYTFEQVQAGIRAYMSENHQYEPKPGQIIARIRGKAEDPGAEAFARRDFMNDYKILLAREQARQAIPKAALEALQRSAEPEKLEDKAADSAITPCISDGQTVKKNTGYTDSEGYQRKRAALYERLKK